MRLTITYSRIKKRNLELINNDTYQRETLSEQPIRQPLRIVPPSQNCRFCENCFCHNLKTDKVKYIKVYISRNGILR